MFDTPHRRFNPLTGESVLVSPHRAKRPWLGQVEKTPAENLPQCDPTCYLCPRNDRAGGVKNPDYDSTFVFDNDFSALLPDPTPELPGKKFIYAHLLITHQPYVFYPDGSFHPYLKQGPLQYRDQIIYANTRLLEIVKTILAESEPAPIIVIQSDHSYFKGVDRVKILNAYFLPDGGNDLLYPTVTPVNTFRIIFNKYFGGQYDSLPDVSI